MPVYKIFEHISYPSLQALWCMVFSHSASSSFRVALRVMNSTHNLVYVESFGSGAVAKPTFSGNGNGVYECQDGDLCQTELYNYGGLYFVVSCWDV